MSPLPPALPGVQGPPPTAVKQPLLIGQDIAGLKRIGQTSVLDILLQRERERQRTPAWVAHVDTFGYHLIVEQFIITDIW